MILLAEISHLMLSDWENFYVIVGSAGGALVGIQFVVIAFLANTRHRAEVETIDAFATPTVVHFSMALVISAIMSAPWPWPHVAAVALMLCGIGGFIYAALVFRRAQRQKVYQPVAEDWVWYAILPCGIHVILTTSALWLLFASTTALFFVAGAALALLMIGIHNAWDTITYLVSTDPPQDAKKAE